MPQDQHSRRTGILCALGCASSSRAGPTHDLKREDGTKDGFKSYQELLSEARTIGISIHATIESSAFQLGISTNIREAPREEERSSQSVVAAEPLSSPLRCRGTNKNGGPCRNKLALKMNAQTYYCHFHDGKSQSKGLALSRQPKLSVEFISVLLQIIALKSPSLAHRCQIIYPPTHDRIRRNLYE